MDGSVLFSVTYLNQEWEELPELSVGPVSSDDVLDELMRWMDVLEDRSLPPRHNGHLILSAAHVEIEVASE